MEDKSMKKAMLVVLMTGLVGGLVFAQTVDDFKIDLTKEGDGIIITGYYPGTAAKVVIPAEIEGIPVRVIGSHAFQNLNITEVVIPNSVTTIGEGAFNECDSLTSITIPNSVTTIGEGAFRGYTSLASITIPNSVTTIGEGAFSGCGSLASITIPNSVTTIGNYAFYRCSSLTSITIPNSVTRIGRSAFNECSSLTSVVLEEGANIDFDYAYDGCFRGCRLDAKSQLALIKAGYRGGF
jgi:hypothetical protein